VAVRAHPDDEGHGLGALGELHPDVAVLGLLPPVEQVGLHRPVLAAERVEPAGVGHPVEDEREQHLQGLGLAGAVVPPQHQPPVGEDELLVGVVPHVDDPGAAGAEPVGHDISPRDSWASCARRGRAALMLR
jgi:hypothetical protein